MKKTAVRKSPVPKAPHRAIYDGSETFLAPWYFSLRTAEEVGRSERHQRALTLMLIQSPRIEVGRLERWFSDQLRATDLICRGPVGQYFVLLIETDESNAWEVGKRILDYSTKLSLSVATLHRDTARFDTLLLQLARIEDAASVA